MFVTVLAAPVSHEVMQSGESSGGTQIRVCHYTINRYVVPVTLFVVLRAKLNACAARG
jgi:hypothetical protein